MISKSDATIIKSDLVIHLYIRSKTEKYFQGDVKSVTSVNDSGVFDILPMHANFITLIKDYVILDKGYPSEKKVEFKSAVASLINDSMDVYVGI